MTSLSIDYELGSHSYKNYFAWLIDILHDFRSGKGTEGEFEMWLVRQGEQAVAYHLLIPSFASVLISVLM